MLPVFMNNDLGGVVYVGKNELCVRFSVGVEHSFRIDTNKLLEVLESRSKDEWETDKFLIEPMYRDINGALMVIITVKFSEQDDDKATVFRCDLITALKAVECFV